MTGVQTCALPISCSKDDKKSSDSSSSTSVDRDKNPCGGAGLSLADFAYSSSLVGSQEAKDQAADIVGLAQKRAGDMIEESKQSAKEEGERIVTAARAEIDREIQKAREGLRQEVAGLAVTAAEKILRAEVDQKKHHALVDQLGEALDKKS